MKPTFRPVVYAHHKRKDGTYNVKINIYFNGKERRLPTTIYCTKNDLTRTHHIKSQDILNKCNVLIRKMHDAIADISTFDLEDKDVDWLVARIKGKLQAGAFRLDFFQFANTFLQGKSIGTRKTYESALNMFALFLKQDAIDINYITKRMIVEFVEWCAQQPKYYRHKSTGELIPSKSKKSKKKGLTAEIYIRKLATIFKEAKARYNDNDEEAVMIPRSPFDNIHIETEQVEGEKPLPKEVVQMLIADDTQRVNTYRLALDALVVSFGLMGMNLADLYDARPPKNGELTYYRSKTTDRRADRAEMRLPVPAELHPYLERLGAGTHKEYWLPRLRGMSKKRDWITSVVNYHSKKWCDTHKIDEFKTYAIRKSWATYARSTGADKSLVDECIAHTGDYDMTDIYALKPYDKMAELNRKVLDMFQW